MVKKEYNQDIGFKFAKNRRQFDEFRQRRHNEQIELLMIDLNNLINSFKKYRITIDSEAVCQEIVNDFPEKLQNILHESKKINPLSHYAPESYNGKEGYREDSVLKLSGRKYQKKKR